MPIELANTIDFKRVANTFDAYIAAMTAAWPLMASLSLAILTAAILWCALRPARRLPRVHAALVRRMPFVLLAAALAAGVYLGFSKAFLCDDAYISLIYARNLAEGNGLVFNLGERVEGYSNFLWTVALALLIYITPLDPPLIATVLPLILFGLNLVVVFIIGRRLSRRLGYGFFLPVAVMLMSVHGILTNYATSGLETAAASLLVNLGILYLLAPASARSSFLCGLMLILATLTRPDHAIFYASAGLALAAQLFAAVVRSRRDGAPLTIGVLKNPAAFAAPFLLYVAFLTWRYFYYGDLVPNTYYTKSVALSYLSQGFMYVERFYLETHFAIPMLFFIVWLLVPFRSDAVGRMKVFALTSVVLYHYYILKIGGCFMNGRFFVTLVPIVLIPVEMLVHRLMAATGRHPRLRHGVAAAMLAALAFGAVRVPLPNVPNGYGFIFDEYIPCKVIRWFPLEVKHFSWKMGNRLKEIWTDRGLRPTISTHGIGMIAYYSRLETIDKLGLTDKFVARLPLRYRGNPGHEKHAPVEYLLERGVVVRRGSPQRAPNHLKNVPKIFWGPGLDDGWCLAKYDLEWVARFRQISPEMQFTDLEWFLDHRYMPDMHKLPSARLLSDLEWLEEYYFFHNDDPERHNRFLDLLEAFTLPSCAPPEPEPAPVCQNDIDRGREGRAAISAP